MTPTALVVRTESAVRTLRPGWSYQVGRDPAAEVPIDDSRVSWRHGVLRTDERGVWIFEDLGSRNGTFIGGRRIRRVSIEGEIRFRVGDAEDGAQLICSAPPVMERWAGV
jgi:pSer/pThr/pTyr-binding forkhead associated (FHA) protein